MSNLNNNLPSKVNIIGDGTSLGTSIYDAKTNKILDKVQSFEYEINVKSPSGIKIYYLDEENNILNFNCEINVMIINPDITEHYKPYKLCEMCNGVGLDPDAYDQTVCYFCKGIGAIERNINV